VYKLNMSIERPNEEPYEISSNLLNLDLLVATIKAVVEDIDPREKSRQAEIQKAIDFKVNHSCPPTYAEG